VVIQVKTNRKTVDFVVQYVNRAGELSAVPVRVSLAWCKLHGMDASQAAFYHVRAKVGDFATFQVPVPEPVPKAA